MKTYVLFCFFIVAVAFVNGQDLHINGGETLLQGSLQTLGENGELQTAWDVQNISSSTLSIRAKRIMETEVAGSGNYFCWGVCFLENTNVSPASVAQILAPGEINTSFYAHYRPYNHAGQTRIQYCFFETDNESNQVCRTVSYCVDADCVVAIGEKEKPATLSDIAPNPFLGIGKIAYHLPADAAQPTLTFYNAWGKMIRQVKLNNRREGMVFLNSTDFDNGLYIYTLTTGGKTQITKKMMVMN